MEFNPYQTPAANVATSASMDRAQAEAIRKQYLNHEASVRSIALLYYLGAFGLLVSSAVLLVVPTQQGEGLSLPILAALFGLGALYLWVGTGLRRLQQSIRVPAAVVAALGLVSFPVGTLINGYILYLLLSAKGKMVFSAQYREVIDATPHIKYRTSLLVWLLLGIVILGIGAAFVIPLLQR